MYDGQEELDNLAWDKNDEDSEESQKQMRLKTTCRQVEHLAEQKFGRPATLVSPLIMGGFNILYRMHLEGVSPDFIARLPCPSLVQFLDEKKSSRGWHGSLCCEKHFGPYPSPVLFWSGFYSGAFCHFTIHRKSWEHVYQTDDT